MERHLNNSDWENLVDVLNYKDLYGLHVDMLDCG